jgi:putative intracellular protease/amidase
MSRKQQAGRRAGLLAALAVAFGLTGAANQGLAQPGAASPPVDFDAAVVGLRFKPDKLDGNLDASAKANGLLDVEEMALVAAVLNDPTFDLSARGGASHAQARAAYDQALASATTDAARLLKSYPTAPVVVAGYAMLGEGSFKAFDRMTTAFGAPLKGGYTLAIAQGRFFSADGDADGDGASNRAEYQAFRKDGRAAYVKAALDPTIAPTAAASPAAAPAAQRRVIGIVLYPGFEVLDVFGPLEMWANDPSFEVVLIAEQAGDVRSAQGAVVKADHGFADAPALDILMVPGGAGTLAQLENPAMLDFIRLQDRSTDFTTSVCTGSALLAKAGVLKGRKATSNKAAFSLAVQQDSSVTWLKRARWVEDGKYFTSSGVSAGTDMALALVARIHGKPHARALADSLEYRWNDRADDDPFAIR